MVQPTAVRSSLVVFKQPGAHCAVLCCALAASCSRVCWLLSDSTWPYHTVPTRHLQAGDRHKGKLHSLCWSRHHHICGGVNIREKLHR
jgi:hypothetical protein